MRDHFDRAAFDRDVADMATYAPEQIGRTQFLTPKGYLYCTGVRIARTGPMLYRPDEPAVAEVTPNPDGSMTVIVRDADVLFAAETLESFNGMDVTDDHPDAMLDPDSDRSLSAGTIMNPRRGEGLDSEYLVADLLIKSSRLIKAIQARKKLQVSCGYDAEVEEIRPGLGRQTRIVGNHAAIVDRGRAGPACAIQDEEPTMATPKKKWFDRLRKAFKDSDEAGLEAALAAAPEDMTDEDDDGTQRVEIVVSAAPAAAADDDTELEGRIAKIEEGLTGLTAAFDKFVADNAPPADDEVKPTNDEDADEEKPASSEEVMDSIAKAECILPGYKPGTMDSAVGKTVTALRRDVLTRAFADTARRPHVEAIVGKEADFAAMSPREMRRVFDGAAAVAKMANNAPRVRLADIPQGRMTPEKMQAAIIARRAARK